MNALQICGICGISVGKNIQRGYSHADFADLADFLFRYYYVVHECTTDLRNQRDLRGKNIQRGYSHADLAYLADFLFSSPLRPFPEQNGK